MAAPADSDAPRTDRHALREVAGVFLKLGTIAFGGPAAHIAMMEDEMVRRRGWVTRETFLDLMAASNLIPGPTSTELAIHLGYRRAGWRGLLIAGCCFILPAMLIVGAIAWAYVRYGDLPQLKGILYGVKPVVIAIVAQALWRLGKTAIKNWPLVLVGLGGVALGLSGVQPLPLLFGIGLAVAAARWLGARAASARLLGIWWLPILPLGEAGGAVVGPTSAAAIGLWPLFLVFLKIGAVLFGSGYVLLAFLQADLVDRLGWLTRSQLLDAVAVGQVTPGPVFTTATFIGYVLAGIPGAIVATAAIFLPAFVLVAASGPFIPRLRKSPTMAAFLDGLNVASLSLMAVVTCQLASAAFLNPTTAALDPIAVAAGAASALLLIARNVNATWLVAAGALIGLLFQH